MVKIGNHKTSYDLVGEEGTISSKTGSLLYKTGKNGRIVSKSEQPSTKTLDEESIVVTHTPTTAPPKRNTECSPRYAEDQKASLTGTEPPIFHDAQVQKADAAIHKSSGCFSNSKKDNNALRSRSTAQSSTPEFTPRLKPSGVNAETGTKGCVENTLDRPDHEKKHNAVSPTYNVTQPDTIQKRPNKPTHAQAAFQSTQNVQHSVVVRRSPADHGFHVSQVKPEKYEDIDPKRPDCKPNVKATQSFLQHDPGNVGHQRQRKVAHNPGLRTHKKRAHLPDRIAYSPSGNGPPTRTKKLEHSVPRSAASSERFAVHSKPEPEGSTSVPEKKNVDDIDDCLGPFSAHNRGRRMAQDSI
jgi:hypothetical protein